MDVSSDSDDTELDQLFSNLNKLIDNSDDMELPDLSFLDTKPAEMWHYLCSVCNENFTEDMDLARHLLRHHDGHDTSMITYDVFYCFQCKYVYVDKAEAFRHVNKIHPDLNDFYNGKVIKIKLQRIERKQEVPSPQEFKILPLPNNSTKEEKMKKIPNLIPLRNSPNLNLGYRSNAKTNYKKKILMKKDTINFQSSSNFISSNVPNIGYGLDDGDDYPMIIDDSLLEQNLVVDDEEDRFDDDNDMFFGFTTREIELAREKTFQFNSDEFLVKSQSLLKPIPVLKSCLETEIDMQEEKEEIVLDIDFVEEESSNFDMNSTCSSGTLSAFGGDVSLSRSSSKKDNELNAMKERERRSCLKSLFQDLAQVMHGMKDKVRRPCKQLILTEATNMCHKLTEENFELLREVAGQKQIRQKYVDILKKNGYEVKITYADPLEQGGDVNAAAIAGGGEEEDDDEEDYCFVIESEDGDEDRDTILIVEETPNYV